MKNLSKLLSTMIIGFFSLLTVGAQTDIGFYTGITSGNVELDGINGAIVPDIQNIQSALIGAKINYTLDQKFSISSGLQYAQKGFDMHESTDIDILGLDVPIGAKVKTRVNTIEIPVHLRYSMGNSKYKGYVLAGPHVSYATSGSLRTYASTFLDFGLTDRDIDFSSERFNRTTFGGSLGIGGEASYGKGKFFGEISYQKDFSDFMYEQTINASLAHKGTAFKIGYMITL